MNSIIRFRDRVNADEPFVRYKTLVGFETILPQQWEDEDRDFQKLEEFRTGEAERYIDAITAENETEWFAFIERCAETKSNDGATFLIFTKLLTNLACRKPETTKRLLTSASLDLLKFLTAILDGLYLGDRTSWRQCIEEHLSAKTNLEAIVNHWRSSKLLEPELIKAVLEAAIASDDDGAVQQCILYAMETGPDNGVPPNSEFFDVALNYVKRKKLTRWVRWAWFAHKSLPFLDALTAEEAKSLLNAVVDVPNIEFQLERIVSQIARRHLALVWEFLGHRLKNRAAHDGDHRYEAFPYQFRGLGKQLSKDAPLAISMVRHWYAEDSTLFRFIGGRLLSTAFPNFTPEIADALGRLVTSGTSTDSNFVLGVMENYRGEPATHEVLKRIVAKYPNDEEKLTGVSISLGNTGVVSGELGYVDAIRRKKAVVEPWLTDDRPAVRTFAETYMREADVRIADEQRRAETRKALRELDYGDDDEDAEGDQGNGEEGDGSPPKPTAPD
jgi:hypothetical protein